MGYGLLLLLACLRSNSATAQDFEPLTLDRPQPLQPQPLQPRSNPLNELPAPPIPESVLDIPGKIVVEQFDFTGSTVFSQAKLTSAIAEFTGQPITFAQLVQAANAITGLYVERGYITSGAYVPEQNLELGSIKIQIVEGSLAEIKVNVIINNSAVNIFRTTPLDPRELKENTRILLPTLQQIYSWLIEPLETELASDRIETIVFVLNGRLQNIPSDPEQTFIVTDDRQTMDLNFLSVLLASNNSTQPELIVLSAL